MKDIKINVSCETRMVNLDKTIIGNDGENLQGNLIFTFDKFVDGQARLEYKTAEKEGYIILEKVNETYQAPIKSVITQKGQIEMQLVITEGIEENEIPIFKSIIFYLQCNNSINLLIDEPSEYPQWIDIANTKLNQVDNLDIEAVKEEGVATITITKKDGSQESVEIYDGDIGTGGGTSDYLQLENKPYINNIELTGNKTLEDLNIQPKGDYLTEIPSEYVTENELNDAINNIDIPDVDLTGYATEEYVDDSIANIDVPEPDLSNYYTKEEVDNVVANAGGNDDILILEYNDKSEETLTKIQNAINSHYKRGLHIIVKTNVGYIDTDDKGLLLYHGLHYQTTQYQFNTYTPQPIKNKDYYRIYVDGTWENDVFTVTKVSYQKNSALYIVLTTDNTTSYTPTGNYNPATKKYVDDQVGAINTILATLTTVEEGE